MERLPYPPTRMPISDWMRSIRQSAGGLSKLSNRFGYALPSPVELFGNFGGILMKLFFGEQSRRKLLSPLSRS